MAKHFIQIKTDRGHFVDLTAERPYHNRKEASERVQTLKERMKGQGFEYKVQSREE